MSPLTSLYYYLSFGSRFVKNKQLLLLPLHGSGAGSLTTPFIIAHTPAFSLESPWTARSPPSATPRLPVSLEMRRKTAAPRALRRRTVESPTVGAVVRILRLVLGSRRHSTSPRPAPEPRHSAQDRLTKESLQRPLRTAQSGSCGTTPWPSSGTSTRRSWSFRGNWHRTTASSPLSASRSTVPWTS